ncbi:virulence protein RhuM/Fic/DOC family protein [Flammeovirga aprica]|uniref:Virulence protein RhuM/Fic/DOC family protein n=1 Tax=Flammeovirga aprica JL-4 TaxID=694437 RepID=A0A7X9RQM0_9BACT|nr:virulence protein RhuM/Fic/DOC family protein [Flammeovirga aprica]NME66903.1 virulence protein RhuM/Fic/DOC family protein [Flammeovirga aprica JL-4]
MKRSPEIIIFSSQSGVTEFKVVLDHEEDTVWVSDQQMIDLFGKARRTIGEHIRNIYEEGELEKEATWREFRQVQQEGNRQVSRKVSSYNLDMVISVGFRVKSKVGIEFRQWALQKLKEYLLNGYSLNEQLLTQKSDQVERLQEEIVLLNKKLLESKNEIKTGFLGIITNYARSFELLSKYDNEELTTSGLNEDIIYVINYEEVKRAIKALKEDLMGKGEAGELFGNEKDDSFQGLLGSISQTVFGQLAYPSIEEQAAQLLYSVIKGHAFSDGNKRIGSFLFVWFLEQNQFHLKMDGQKKITDNTLVVLALAVAQSLPEQRELIIKLIINLIK